MEAAKDDGGGGGSEGDEEDEETEGTEEGSISRLGVGGVGGVEGEEEGEVGDGNRVVQDVGGDEAVEEDEGDADEAEVEGDEEDEGDEGDEDESVRWWKDYCSGGPQIRSNLWNDFKGEHPEWTDGRTNTFKMWRASPDFGEVAFHEGVKSWHVFIQPPPVVARNGDAA